MFAELSSQKLVLFTTWIGLQLGDLVTTFGATAYHPALREINPMIADDAGNPVAWKILLGKAIFVWVFWKLISRPNTKRLWLYWTITAVFAVVVAGNALTWWLV